MEQNKKSRLTPRQLETLQKIYQLTAAQCGTPPTISELGRAMGVSSDQAVIELLNRLQAKALVERPTGQARGIRLTVRGRNVIGVPAPVGLAEGRGGAIGTRFNVYQRRIVERLAEIDPKLSLMYVGGLHVLQDADNPDRIAQSAQSIRESTHHLSNLGKDLLTPAEAKAAKSLECSNARQLERVLDPLGGVPFLDENLYDTWNRDFHQFFVRISHHAQVTPDEYAAQLGKFEEFLNRYVFPRQAEVYELIDRSLSEAPPASRPLELKLLLSRNLESYRYFFRNANVRWLDFLDEHHFLRGSWECADYLARVAPDAPEKVMAIIEQLPTRQEDWAARWAMLQAAVRMPSAISAQLLPKIEREEWVNGFPDEHLSHYFEPFVGHLIAGGAHKEALRLSRMVLGRSSKHHLHDYWCAEFLKQFSLVPNAELIPYLELLANLLRSALEAEGRNAQSDYSSIWRPAIEDAEENLPLSDVKDVLVSHLRNGLERYAAQAIQDHRTGWRQSIGPILDAEPRYSIFVRLQLHLYRLHPAEFASEIEHAVTVYFDDDRVWHEYSLLVRKVFLTLPPATQQEYLALVDGGPKIEPSAEYRGYWQARRLALISVHLSPVERAKRASLLARAADVGDVETPHTSTFGFIGPTAPTTAGELASMPVEALVEYLATWCPGSAWGEPSREGLGRELFTAVGQKPREFSSEALRFADTRLRPAYIYHFLRGLTTAIRAKQELAWEPVVGLVGEIVARASRSELPIFAPDSGTINWDLNWEAVYQEIGSLLEAALNLREAGPELTARERVWDCVAFLCEHHDPTPEHENKFGGKNMDPFTLSINTVRGTAFHALFAYVYWCDRHLRDVGNLKERIMPEAKAVLRRHLDITHDSSLAIRSVYGRNFPWLYIYEPSWASELVPLLFPAGNVALRYAAWETYLSNNVFDPVYRALRPQYDQAISELPTLKEDRRFWSDPVQHLGMHVMTAYVYSLDDEPHSLWEKFFRTATSKQRGMAVSFCGHVYAERVALDASEEHPRVERLREFWDWRLRESEEVDELRAFGSWAQSDKFGDEWLLEHLRATLEKTRGLIEGEPIVLARLHSLTPRYPLLCLRALDLFVKARPRNWVLWGPNEDIVGILTSARGSEQPGIVARADRIIDYLTRLGLESYRSLLRRNQPKADREVGAIG